MLQGVKYKSLKELPARASWAESSVKLKDIRDPVGNGGVARVLWEIKASPPRHPPTWPVPA